MRSAENYRKKSRLTPLLSECSPLPMELRKDPITRSWVITGDDPAETGPRAESACLFCEDSTASLQVIAKSPNAPGAPWSARSVVHPTPLYRIEGEPDRRGDGIYDRMHSVGAHEVLVENPRHDRHLWSASDDEIAHFLRLAAERILDLKRDPAHQVRQPVQGLRQERRTGIQPSHFADHRHHVRSAARALRVARRPRIFRRQGTLRLLRHHPAGGATGPARHRGPRGLSRALSLRPARPLRNLDSAAQPRRFFRAHRIESSPGCG